MKVVVALLLDLAVLLDFILRVIVAAEPESPSHLTTPQLYHVSGLGGIVHTTTFQQHMPDLVGERLRRHISLQARQVY